VLIVLPLAATGTVDDASQTGAICQHDLATVRATLQVHAPLYVMLADMENVPGFCELLEQFPDARQRQYVLGQPFPLMPDADAQDVPRMIGHGVEWLFDTLFPTNVYRLLKVETPGREQRDDVVRMNGRLFELLVQMRERQKRVVHILTRGIAGKSEGPLLFGGCFLAGTGVDGAREQAFVHGVLRQLIENQNYVSWTKDALDEERDYRRWTQAGYLVIVAVLITAVTVAYMYWPR
jgi:type VI protein secretion system component VasK